MSDLIRREDVKLWNGIRDLPSAEPERTAKVRPLEKRSETVMGWEGVCTNCGAYTIHEMNYCFECGARLEWE